MSTFAPSSDGHNLNICACIGFSTHTPCVEWEQNARWTCRAFFHLQ
nr:MAG TPA: hypothetical protein [Caudoviricetes sp.]